MSNLSAPKDPEKKRPYFYIMKEKEIFGTLQENGTGIQFVYESDGRLINSAQITGNITDERELNLLKTAEGFGKLVHSIGVSVETENPKEKVQFIFQMYGKKDLYGGGTNLTTKIDTDGMEHRIYLSEYQWTEDDYEPGQIKFVFDTPELLGKASVKLYLQDGYDAPENIEEESVQTDSEEYRQMIHRSLMSSGNLEKLQVVIDKARKGEQVTLAYIGGSITQGAGAIPIHTECYAYKSYQLFEQKFSANHNVRFVKAGVGGTPSELGMIRFERDILREDVVPDVVVVEFAVNDEGDETKGVCYESLVRKILRLPNQPAVILLFSVFANDWNLQERLKPVGEQYDLPMVSILDAVTWQFGLKQAQGRVVTKNQFFYDMFHPTNLGHSIMADSLQYLFEAADCLPRKSRKEIGNSEILQKEPVIGNWFETVQLLERRDLPDGISIRQEGFDAIDQELQSVEFDDSLEPIPEFPYNWMYDGKGDVHSYFELEITCRSLLLIYKDSGEIFVGKAEVYVDGKHCITADPHVNNWLHCNAVILFREEESKKHKVRIEVAEEDIDKQFTILGFGFVL